ncbi:MAG: ABC transporter substrate-binding protein [Chitinophagales bacterium]
MRKLILLSLAVAILFAIPAYAADPVRIGALAALTGGASMQGNQAREGALMAEEDLNAKGGVLGRKVKVYIEDSQGVPTTAVNAFRKLVDDDKVSAVVGDHQSTAVLAFKPIAIQMGIPVLATGSAMAITQDANPWIFRVREYDALAANALVNAAVKSGAKKIAIFHNTDQFGVGGRDNIIAALKKKGLTPVAVEGHNTGDKDFTAQLLNIKKSGAEAMIVFTHNEEQGLITRQVNQLIPDIAYYGSMALSQNSTIDMAQGAAEGKFSATPYVASNPDPEVQKFVKRYTAKYGHAPELFSVLYYDSIMMIAKAMEMGKSDKPASVQANLHKIKKFPGVSGLDYTFNEKGEAVGEIFIVKIQNGQPKVAFKIEG